MKKCCGRFLLVFVVVMQLIALPVFAVDATTVVPKTDENVADCKRFMNWVSGHQEAVETAFRDRATVAGVPFNRVQPSEPSDGSTTWDGDDVLGCGIKTGDIRLWMIPFYIRYLLEFVIQIAGLVAVGGIVFGGYLYLFAGISEDKDRGKKAILYSVAGMAMTLVAWAVVNIVIAVVTA